MIFPIFLPHLGCGRRCTYCNQHVITSRQAGDLARSLPADMSLLQSGSEVALYGGNPLGLPADELAALLSLLAPWKDKIRNVRISAKPGKIMPEMLEVLKAHHVTVVELGIPSFNDRILRELGRGHTVEDFRTAYGLLTEEGFTVGIQVMVGLPGEKTADLQETAEHIKNLRPSFLRIYPLVVLKGTDLERLHREKGFFPVTLEEAVDRTLFLYLNALNQGVPVIKMGLTENDMVQESVVAGPYHPAFGALVKARAFYLSLIGLCHRFSLTGDVIVMVNDHDIPNLVGHRRSNLRNLKEEGILLRWEKADVEVGSFVVKSGSIEARGNVNDALATIPFSDLTPPRTQSLS